MQLQLMANLQLARRDVYLSMMPKYVPDEALNMLRQAPLGGEYLFGAEAMKLAHSAKEKGELGKVHQAMIKATTPATE
jgi:hypothetical protein